MSQSIISDNWSLQNISELLTNGLDSDNTNYIDVDSKNDKFSYGEVSNAAITIEAFFDFITDIILRNQILVESDFVHAWKKYDCIVNKVPEAGIIREYPFLVDHKKLEEPRNEFVQRLCLTEDLKQVMRKIE